MYGITLESSPRFRWLTLSVKSCFASGFSVENICTPVPSSASRSTNASSLPSLVSSMKLSSLMVNLRYAITGFSGVKWTLIPSPSMSASSPMSTPFVPLASVNVAVAASPVGVISASTSDSKTAVLFLGPFLTLPFILTTSSFCSMPRDMVSSRAAPVFSPRM